TIAQSLASCTDSAHTWHSDPSNSSTRSRSFPTLFGRNTENCVTIGGAYPCVVSSGVGAWLIGRLSESNGRPSKPATHPRAAAAPPAQSTRPACTRRGRGTSTPDPCGQVAQAGSISHHIPRHTSQNTALAAIDKQKPRPESKTRLQPATFRRVPVEPGH